MLSILTVGIFGFNFSIGEPLGEWSLLHKECQEIAITSKYIDAYRKWKEYIIDNFLEIKNIQLALKATKKK